MHGINIFSGEKGLGGALTNPTELARKKGSIEEYYPVRYAARNWPDVETAYHVLKTENTVENDELMAELIAAKLRQHPTLMAQIEQRGGKEFLLLCSHFTGAKSEQAKSWEGQGLASRFIRNLVKGHDKARHAVAMNFGQYSMF